MVPKQTGSLNPAEEVFSPLKDDELETASDLPCFDSVSQKLVALQVHSCPPPEGSLLRFCSPSSDDTLTSSTLKIDLVNPCEEASWDQQILAFPHSNVFHSSAWACALQECYGLRPIYLVARDCKNNITGCLPLMEVPSSWTGLRGVALPFSDFVPMLANDLNVADELIQRAIGIGWERHWRYIEFKGPIPNLRNASACPASAWRGDRAHSQDEHECCPPPSVAYFNHTLDITRPQSELFAGFENSTRRAIRKAEKSGVQIEFSSSVESMESFYKLHRLTRRRHGLPPQPKCFFLALFKHLIVSGKGQIALAKLDQRLMGASIFLTHGTAVLFKFGASDPSQQEYRPNNAIIWNAIQHYSNQGLTRIDFGRCSIQNVGLRRFKRGFGTFEKRIEYYKFNYRNGQFAIDQDMAFSWFTKVFALMPLGVSRMVGNVLYKHLA